MNPNLWVLCDEFYDPDMIDIPCDENRIPSAAPSVSSSPTSSSPPTISSPPSLIPTSSSAPTIFPDCSCGVGEFKFELELKPDFSPEETSWGIQNENGDTLHSETGYDYYGEAFTILNYEYCLPVGCYDFIIDDSLGDGICCISDYYDDGYFDDYYLDYYGIEGIDHFDGYYKGIVYGRKEVFNGGQFGFNATEHFCGEDVCPFATHYPSTSPSASSPPSISPSLSTSPSASSRPSISSSSTPTITPDCSCGVGEFKLELELKTDLWPYDTSWKIQNENGDILFANEALYDDRLKTYNSEYCLLVGCYDFVIDDRNGDGICCGRGDGYYTGRVYGWKEVFNGGQFGSNATEHFCGEDVCA